MAERFSVRVNETEAVTATAYPASAADAPVLVLAHGAGAPQAHPFMIEMARDLPLRGVSVTTFDFVYTEKKKRAPDKPPLLEACYRAIAADARGRAPGRALFLGGKSMGGRIASQIAPGEEGLAGLVFLGYPLHPPGKPEQLRAKHLPLVKAPMLFVQGSKDAFGTPEELAPILAGLPARVFAIDGGDHSFKVPKSAGVSQTDVMTRIKDEVARFVMEHAK